jgi:hypothetical protein
MERRRAIRTRTYQPARVSLAPTDEDTYFCIVHNRTDCGFCIELTFDAVELPDCFEFSFDGFRTVHTCRTIWREDNVAGVHFQGPPPLQSPESRRARFRIVSQ